MASILEFLRRVWEENSRYWLEFLRLINPITWYNNAVAWIDAFMPDPANQAEYVMGQVNASFAGFYEYIGFMDYFVNLTMLSIVLITIFIIEASLFLFRIERMIRSLFF